MAEFKKIILQLFVFGVALLIWGFAIEPGFLTHRTVKVKWRGPSLKIVFFSDLHAGSPHIKEKYILNLVKEINAEKPDLIVIGGDLAITHLAGGKPIPMEQVAEWLGGLQARFGVFAVLGNHDWWNQPELIRDQLRAHNIQVIDNQSRMITLGEFKFWLVGIADDFTQHAEPGLALAGAKDPMILFMHDPGTLLDVQHPFVLALAGHTHGGQIGVPGVGALVSTGRAPRAWARGRTDLPNGPLFVTNGIGTSILPVRLNAPPEYVIVELDP